MILLLSECTKHITQPDENTGILKIFLTDAPSSYEAVNVTFSTISAHIDSEWVKVQAEPVKINLLEWNNGKSIEVGAAEVPAGHYTQIRLIIEDAEIIVDEISHPLSVPSGAQTGLKLGPEFDVQAGSTYELVIDFDVHRSIVVTGPKWNPKGYKLKPHLRVTPKAITGSISGTVENPENVPLAYAIQEIENMADPDTVTTAVVDTTTGKFFLSFLPEGSYKVSVRDTLDLFYDIENVMVTAGTDNQLASFTLHE
jgi:hypothetical protein